MKKSNSIFEVDVKGFRALQAGKPKWMIVRELIANALDENITQCAISFSYLSGKATIIVEDDSAEGFVDLSHAYTLFADTRKRSNPNVRGRFNLGEKQVIVLCDYVRIISTKGGVEFDILKGTRSDTRKKRDAGSEVMVVVRMDKSEYLECIEYCKQILSPKRFFVLNKTAISGATSFEFNVEYKRPYKTFTAKLKTELKDTESGDMKMVTRDTAVNLHTKESTGGTAYIYELGIPICEIECDYSIDVQQKVPLSSDRDKVDGKYLKVIYGEVLNIVRDEIKPEQSSNLWVRDGFASDRATKEARQDIITKRFGEKALIANPNDRRSMDEAISNNYNVVYGSEMSKEEWGKVKEDNLLISTSAQFKCGVAEGKMVSPNAEQKMIADFCKKVAKDIMDISISVKFYDSPDATVRADYSSERNELRFNVAHFADADWKQVVGGNGKPRIQQPMLDLIIHELGHSEGWHYEQSYHDCITMLGSALAIKALEQPEWFTLGVKKVVVA